MKKRKIFLLIFVTLFIAVGCTGAPEKKDAPAGTAETQTETTGEKTKQQANAKAPELLKSESELGIVHPMHFAKEMKIYDAEEVLEMKRYEVSRWMDETHVMFLGTPLFKNCLALTISEADSPEDAENGLFHTLAGGYYNLETGEIVKIAEAGQAEFPSSEDLDGIGLYPLDEERILFEKVTKDGLYYSIYHIADGSRTDFIRFEDTGEYSYAGAPYTIEDKIYIVEPLRSVNRRTHIFDAKTGKEIGVQEEATDVCITEDGPVYVKNYKDGEDGWIQELTVGDDAYTWESKNGESYLNCGITTDPETVYVLSSYLGTDEYKEDLLPEEREDDAAYIPYDVVHRLPGLEPLVSMRGDHLIMETSGPWMALSRSVWQDTRMDAPSYLVIPGEKTALRISVPEFSYWFYLLPYARYGALMTYDANDEEAKTLIVYTLEEKK